MKLFNGPGSIRAFLEDLAATACFAGICVGGGFIAWAVLQ